MNPDEYQQAWHAHASRTRVTIDTESLLKEMQRSDRSFRSTIFWRDFREVVVALVMLPLWLLLGITMSLPWTWYLTMPVLIWLIGFILVDRWRHPQRPTDPGAPLLQCVKESLSQVEHQIWLLRNILWWYLLPPSVSVMAFFAHTSWTAAGSWWLFGICVAGSGVFLWVIYGAVYRLNQTAVREHLEPRRQHLLKLVASLEDDGTDTESHEVAGLVSTLADPALNCSARASSTRGVCNGDHAGRPLRSILWTVVSD